MKKRLQKWLREQVLHPWVLRNKGEVLGLIRQQPDYRDHVVGQLYKQRMGWTHINKALKALGLKTVKCYYMNRNGLPHVFFEVPTQERRKELPRLTVIVEEN
jgi:hypothetical protein